MCKCEIRRQWTPYTIHFHFKCLENHRHTQSLYYQIFAFHQATRFLHCTKAKMSLAFHIKSYYYKNSLLILASCAAQLKNPRFRITSKVHKAGTSPFYYPLFSFTICRKFNPAARKQRGRCLWKEIITHRATIVFNNQHRFPGRNRNRTDAGPTADRSNVKGTPMSPWWVGYAVAKNRGVHRIRLTDRRVADRIVLQTLAREPFTQAPGFGFKPCHCRVRIPLMN